MLFHPSDCYNIGNMTSKCTIVHCGWIKGLTDLRITATGPGAKGIWWPLCQNMCFKSLCNHNETENQLQNHTSQLQKDEGCKRCKTKQLRYHPPVFEVLFTCLCPGSRCLIICPDFQTTVADLGFF